MKSISVADDFSIYPAGGTKDDSPLSGESFRIKFLEPAIDLFLNGYIADKIVVNLDNTKGYGSNWIREAFGGLVHSGKYTKEQVLDALDIKSKDKSIILEINLYLNDK